MPPAQPAVIGLTIPKQSPLRRSRWIRLDFCMGFSRSRNLNPMRPLPIILAISLVASTDVAAQTGSKGEIQLKSGHAAYTWNGTTLRSKWGSQASATWTFDGKRLRSTFPTDSTASFEWDGRELTPTFRATGRTTYVWNGSELKPKFGASFSNTWIFKRGEWHPKNGAQFDKTWLVKGDVPIPVVAIVVYGIVD